jgi:hypothetical protein
MLILQALAHFAQDCLLTLLWEIEKRWLEESE